MSRDLYADFNGRIPDVNFALGPFGLLHHDVGVKNPNPDE